MAGRKTSEVVAWESPRVRVVVSVCRYCTMGATNDNKRTTNETEPRARRVPTRDWGIHAFDEKVKVVVTLQQWADMYINLPLGNRKYS